MTATQEATVRRETNLRRLAREWAAWERQQDDIKRLGIVVGRITHQPKRKES